jgi:hypothetical protein
MGYAQAGDESGWGFEIWQFIILKKGDDSTSGISAFVNRVFLFRDETAAVPVGTIAT